MNPVIHFEMPYESGSRMAKFYESVFGWKTQQLGAEMNKYVLATTFEPSSSAPSYPGAINGGFYEKMPDRPMQYPSVVIGVDNIDSAMKQIVASGGKLMGEPMEIPGVGKYLSFTDTEGNRVSVLQPMMR